MTVKEFLKALEDIKRTRGYNHFDLYLEYDDEYAQVWLGKYEPDTWYNEDSIIPISRNLVDFHTKDVEGDFVEIYDTVEKFKKSIKQNKISDNAVIQLTTTNMTLDDLYIDYSHNKFDIIKVVPAKRKNTVVLMIDDFGTAPQLKTYEVTYTVWEQNKYSVDIEAYSEEEAEAIFEEDNNNSTYPDKKDFEVVSVEKA